MFWVHAFAPSQKNIRWINRTQGFRQSQRLCGITQVMKTLLSRGTADLAGHIQYFIPLSPSTQTLTLSNITAGNYSACATHHLSIIICTVSFHAGQQKLFFIYSSFPLYNLKHLNRKHIIKLLMLQLQRLFANSSVHTQYNLIYSRNKAH